MAYSHIQGGRVVWGDGEHYFLFNKFLKYSIGNCLIFWQIFQNFSFIERARGQYLPDLLSTWPFRQTFQNFPPLFLSGVEKYVSWGWWKSELMEGEGNLTYMRVGTKLLAKNITKKIVSLFCFLKEATLSFLTDAVDIFLL